MDITMPALASIGIDIGKDVFHLVAFDTAGKIAFRRKIKRPPIPKPISLASSSRSIHFSAERRHLPSPTA